MVQWLAVVVFCVGGECAFWASIHEPLASKDECQALAAQVHVHFEEQGAELVAATCLPVNWAGKRI
jgi:hypothetical protein